MPNSNYIFAYPEVMDMVILPQYQDVPEEDMETFKASVADGMAIARSLAVNDPGRILRYKGWGYHFDGSGGIIMAIAKIVEDLDPESAKPNKKGEYKRVRFCFCEMGLAKEIKLSDYRLEKGQILDYTVVKCDVVPKFTHKVYTKEEVDNARINEGVEVSLTEKELDIIALGQQQTEHELAILEMKIGGVSNAE